MNLLQSLTAYTVNTPPAEPEACVRSGGYPFFTHKFLVAIINLIL